MARTRAKGGRKDMTENAELKDFILSRLNDDDRERLEEALFADDEVFEAMVEAEEDLIDSWAREELSPAERRLVEQTFASRSEGVERLRFARGFVSRADGGLLAPVATFRRRAATWLPVAAAAAVALTVAGLWIAEERRSSEKISGNGRVALHSPRRTPANGTPVTNRPSQPVSVARSERTPAPVAAAVAEPTPAETIIRPATLALSLAVVRSESAVPAVSLTGGQPLELSVALDPQDRYDEYDVRITDANGNVVIRQTATAAANGQAGFELSLPQLEAGVYELAVSSDGLDLGFISFRVNR